MTPEEKAVHERRQLEADLKERGTIILPLDLEIKRTEQEIEKYIKDQERDPRVEALEIEKKRFKLLTLKLSDDILSLAKQPAFRRFCWKILEESGMFKLSYTRGSPEDTFVKEGRRSVGHDVLAILQTVDPGIFLQMQREHISDIKSQQEKPNGE